MSVENDAARTAKSGAIAGQVRVLSLRPGLFCPGKGRGRGASGWVCWAGFGGQNAIVPRPRMMERAQGRVTARSHLEVDDSQLSRS